ncbi:MAG: calcium-binding protein, partial [Pseudomonadota bacterium]
SFYFAAGDASELDTYIGGAGTDIIINSDISANFTFTNYDSTGTTTLNGSEIEEFHLNNGTMVGSANADTFNFTGLTFRGLNNSTTVTKVNSGDGDDTIIGTNVTGFNYSGFGGYSVMQYELGDGDDNFTGNGNISDRVFGGDGIDTINAGDGNDVLQGGAGADILRGENGADIFNVTVGEQSELDTFIGGAGSDTLINATGGNFTLSTFVNSDVTGTINGSSVEVLRFSNATLEGTSGDNVFDFSNTVFQFVYNSTVLTNVDTGAGNDTVTGTNLTGTNASGFGGRAIFQYDLGTGNDTFDGTGGIVDRVFGGDGDDIINAGAGNDFLDGQGDDDTFIFEAGDGADTIQGFVAGAGTEDQVDLSSFGFTAFDNGGVNDVQSLLSQSGANVLLNFGGGDSILFTSQTVANFDDDDFII